MPTTGISDINNFNSLYSAYARLKNEGEHTTSAKNAKAIFGQNIDVDGNNTVELWEFMQKANETQNKIIFDEIEPLKSVKNNKYPQISDDNPINIILSIEGEVTGEGKTAKAYSTINDIIKVAKDKITVDMSLDEKLGVIYRAIHNDLNIKQSVDPEGVDLLSEGLSKEEKTVDCDTGGFMYIAVAHELGLPIYLATNLDHAFVFHKASEGRYLEFETTTILSMRNEDRSRLQQEAETIINSGNDYLFSVVYKNRGDVYLEQGKCDRAINDYSMAINLRPGFAVAYNNLGNVYGSMGKFDNAVDEYSSAIKFEPDYPIPYWNRSKAYSELGKFELAEKDLEMARKLSK
jgi:tetratricopeptide (TPR) repeat protein